MHTRRSKFKKRSAVAKKPNFDLNIVRKFLKGYTPTKRDIRRPMKTNELMTLCRRVHCYVDMTRWNAVYDYSHQFQRQGRLQCKSKREANMLLAKAVNRHKAQAVYTDEEIQAANAVSWRLRKKENLLRLRLWANDEKDAKEFLDSL